ncbi:MAG: isoaspartyl peptidase/L-asparaginase [Nitrospirae bacterium]|nr:isoaspartyl peptidase/L-asparaginase [Nitrospirota bacterium]MCL5423048.1 isoaspartyl peptidase/L-asparaginase [Nitrospirota bacterium]
MTILYGVVVHGGAGSPAELSDGCKAACESAFSLLEAGISALDAVAEAARILEDDGRFNAGSGSVLRLDGKTIEMDAGVMDSENNIGMVISIRGVKNPVLVARAVIATPHVALSGQGATAFAKKSGFAPFYQVSELALERHKRVKQLIKEGRLGEENSRWKGYDVDTLWNSDEVSYGEVFSSDTIGVVAMDKDGTTAVAGSTGGSSPMMLGRVGDTPMIGCGFYAGPACAVAATGIGEEIIKKILAKTVYDTVLSGDDIKTACEKGINMYPHEIAVGLIGISKTGYAVTSNRGMASYALMREG